MNQESDDPDDVIYDVDELGRTVIRYVTKRDDFEDRCVYYSKCLEQEAMLLDYDMMHDKSNKQKLEEHKNKITIYSNLANLCELALEHDKIFIDRYVNNVLSNTGSKLCEEDCDLEQLAINTSVCIRKTRKKYKKILEPNDVEKNHETIRRH